MSLNLQRYESLGKFYVGNKIQQSGGNIPIILKHVNKSYLYYIILKIVKVRDCLERKDSHKFVSCSLGQTKKLVGRHCLTVIIQHSHPHQANNNKKVHKMYSLFFPAPFLSLCLTFIRSLPLSLCLPLSPPPPQLFLPSLPPAVSLPDAREVRLASRVRVFLLRFPPLDEGTISRFK